MVKHVSRVALLLTLALSLLSAMTLVPGPAASADDPMPAVMIEGTYDAQGNPTITMSFADVGADHYRWNLIRGPVDGDFDYETNLCAGQCSTIGIGTPTSLSDVVAINPNLEARYWVLMRPVHDGVNGEWTQVGPLTLSHKCGGSPSEFCGLRMIW